MSHSESRSILVTDFDGTMTRHDFYRLIFDEVLPKETPDYWSWYVSGKITHFEALRLTFAAANVGESRLGQIADQMELQPGLEFIIRDREFHGWQVVVASAGCRWYIDRLLRQSNVCLEVHANPGSIDNRRLIMSLPVESPFLSMETGINKAAVVEQAFRISEKVAFAGDGLPDLAPALLVQPELRFARGMLAQVLSLQGYSFRPFDQWSQVVDALRS